MWDLPWTSSATFVDLRMAEELLKRNFGEPKARFSIPINWVDEFDLFSNLRLQDAFGLSPAGAGEFGRYYYVESMTYDFANGNIDVIAVDLQYILRQCMIVPHCGDVAEKWEDASESDRMYAYVGSCYTLTYDNLAGGNFAALDTITGAVSGATAVIDTDDAVDTMTLSDVVGTLQDNEEVDNGAGVTADVNGEVVGSFPSDGEPLKKACPCY